VDAATVLRLLMSKGCRLIPDREQLRVQDPHQALTEDLRQAIRQNKLGLLAILRPTYGKSPSNFHNRAGSGRQAVATSC